MFWMLPLAGAALGAMASKKDPLKGALMGAALGATGGAAGGLLGAGAAAGSAGTAATTAGAVAGDAFLPAALGASGSGASAGIAGLAPSGYTAGGLLGAAGKYAKPAMEGMQAASMAQGLMADEPQAPMQTPQLQQGAPLDLSSIFQGNQQSQLRDMEEQMRRQKEMEQYAMNMMGGR